MLALKSSITTTVKGCVSFWKNVISCGFPLSRIVNSSRSRFGTSRPCASMTVESTGDDARARFERRLLREGCGTREHHESTGQKRPFEPHTGSLATPWSGVNQDPADTS